MKCELLRLIVTSLVIIMGVPASGQNHAAIDSLIKAELADSSIPGITVAVVNNNSIIHQAAYGYASLEHQVATKIETVFELASVTKQFISFATLLLVQDGLLDLDVPISQYLDSIPARWKNITTRQLLSHTGGLAPMSQEWKSLKQSGWPKYVSKEMLWESSLQDDMIGPPGGQFSYHNMGYSLSILIIERITQADHRQFFKKRFFDPLNMTCTYFEDQLRITPNMAQGYTLKDSELVKIWRVGQEEISVGDGLDACLYDLVKWNKALNSHQLL